MLSEAMEGLRISWMRSDGRSRSGQETLQRPCAAHVAEAAQRLLLDLPHPLPGDAQQAPDFLERHRLGPVQAKVEAEDLGLALLQRGEDLLDRFGQSVLEGLGVGAGVLGVGQVVEELVVFAGSERRVEGKMILGNGQRLLHLLHRDVHSLGDLGRGGLPSQLLQERGGSLPDPMQRPGSIQRHPDDPALLGQRLQNGLANPPDRVRDELDALGLVELVGGPDQTEVALVDQVGQGHALVLVLLGHRHDEAEVAADQLVERLAISDPDTLRKADFFFLRDQRVLADFPKVLVQRAFIERRCSLAGTYLHWTHEGNLTPGFYEAQWRIKSTVNSRKSSVHSPTTNHFEPVIAVTSLLQNTLATDD